MQLFFSVFFISSVITIKLGITNSVRIVETSNPNKITFAKGDHICDLPPIPIAIGSRPKTVVNDVKIIGLNLNRPASITLLQRLVLDKCLRSLRSFRNERRTMASFTTIPARATKPKKRNNTKRIIRYKQSKHRSYQGERNRG